jgi:Phage gp6-like head-tail connector protein
MALEFSWITLPPFLTVEDAKALQLRIRDTLHDADITEKLETAHERIIAKLGAAADATWTAETVPKAVSHAILLLTTHYYEHRGDDMNPTASGSTPDADVWAAIDRLLAPYRDLTLA